MAPLRLNDADAASLRALVLLQRYSLRLTEMSDRALGEAATDNFDMQLLAHLQRHPGVSPSQLVSGLRRPRSTVARGLARLLDAGLLERRTHPVDRRRAQLHLTTRGRAGVAHFEQSLSDFFREGEPLVKEVMLLLGRDPERIHRTTSRTSVLELAEVMGAAGAAYGREVLPIVRQAGVSEVVDRFALMVLAQAWARPSWLSDELRLSPAGTSSQLERLEAAGLVVREAGVLDTDRRAVVVHLTSKGRRTARAQLEVFRRHQDALLDALEPTIGFPGVSTGSASLAG